MSDFTPQFETKAHAIARFLGPRDQGTVVNLLQFVIHEKWRGQLVINFTGNGGIQDVVFSEVKRTIPFVEEKC